MITALTDYDLGYTLEGTAMRLKKKTNRRVSPSTITTWLEQYQKHCRYRRLRAAGFQRYPANQTIRSIKLYHRQVYGYTYHLPKVDFVRSGTLDDKRAGDASFAPLADFLESVPTICPHDLFRRDDHPKARASQATPTWGDAARIVINSKRNAATEAAELIIPAVGNNKLRHETLQRFMLCNDSVTVAIEIPIWLAEHDIAALEREHGIELAPRTGTGERAITGHIDFLQVRNGSVHILDYKPDAHTNKPIDHRLVGGDLVAHMDGDVMGAARMRDPQDLPGDRRGHGIDVPHACLCFIIDRDLHGPSDNGSEVNGDRPGPCKPQHHDNGEDCRSALDKAQVDVATNEAALASAQAQLGVRRSERASVAARLIDPSTVNQQANPHCCINIKAPVTGRVLRIIQDSESAVPAGAPLLDIGDPLDLEVVADLLSTEAVQIRAGYSVSIDGWGGSSIRGRVTRVDPAGFLKVSALGIEEQRVRTTIDLVDPSETWAPLGHDYRVIVHVTVWAGKDVLTIPVGSLFRKGNDWAVYAVKGGRARTVLVRIGHRNALLAEVLSGLSPGDRVVLHPSDRVRDGAAISQRETR
jgi:hypothetical protein